MTRKYVNNVSPLQLENEYLRSVIKDLRSEKYTDLVEEIYDWIMANADMGLGESADARMEAENIVINWKNKRNKK
jgi:hypothetical protein